jgi:hypothetical protein
MRTATIPAIVLTALSLVSPHLAIAQCGFDAPGKAKKMKVSLTRAHAECTAPNAMTTSLVDACDPPSAPSSYQFGPNGTCSLQAVVVVEDPCSDAFAPPCSNILFKAKCSDVQDSGGMPVDGSGPWELRGVLRATTNDQTTGDVTVVDEPFGFSFAPASNGKLSLAQDLLDLCFLFPSPACAFRYTACTSFEIHGPTIVDPAGDVFAVPGVSAR